MNRELNWRRSTRCEAAYCVEVATIRSRVLVRDAKLGEDSPVLAFDPDAWTAFVASLRGGEGGDS